MDFITRYGTHYLKAAKFGGQLEIVKKKRKIQGMTISDMRSEEKVKIITLKNNRTIKIFAYAQYFLRLSSKNR